MLLVSIVTDECQETRTKEHMWLMTTKEESMESKQTERDCDTNNNIGLIVIHLINESVRHALNLITILICLT